MWKMKSAYTLYGLYVQLIEVIPLQNLMTEWAMSQLANLIKWPLIYRQWVNKKCKVYQVFKEQFIRPRYLIVSHFKVIEWSAKELKNHANLDNSWFSKNYLPLNSSANTIHVHNVQTTDSKHSLKWCKKLFFGGMMWAKKIWKEQILKN